MNNHQRFGIRLSLLASLLLSGATAAEAAYVNFYLAATESCTVENWDGTQLQVGSDFTQQLLNETGAASTLTAKELSGYKFKGWYTVSGKWTEPADVNAADVRLTDEMTITGATIAGAGVLGNIPAVVAKYVPAYQIATAVSPEGTGSVSGGGIHEQGANVTLKAVPASNYGFKTWLKDGADIGVDTPTLDVKNISAAATYTAVFELISWRVTFDKLGGRNGTDFVTVTKGQHPPTVSVPTKDGYQFSGYSVKSDGSGTMYYQPNGTSDRPWDEDPSVSLLYAQWTPNKYTVNFNKNAGFSATISPTTKQVEFGKPYGDLATADAGTHYTLLGWWDAPTGGRQVAAEAIVPLMNSSPIVLYAHWQTNSYTVTFHDGPEGATASQEITYDTETALTCDVFTKPGYSLAGWTKEPTGTSVDYANGASVKDLGDTDLYALWTTNAYRVAFFANGGAGEMPSMDLTYGTPATLTSNGFTRADFIFAGWAEDPSAAVKYTDGAVVSNLTEQANGMVKLYAKWEGAGYGSDFSRAADCVNLLLETNTPNWSIVSEDPYEGETCIKADVKGVTANEWRTMSVSLPAEAGTFSFWYKTAIASNSDIYDDSIFRFSIAGEGKVNTSTTLPWTQYSSHKTAGAAQGIKWELQFNNKTNAVSDNDYVLIDSVKWVPDTPTPMTLGVTFDLNDGTGEVLTNVTRSSGVAIGSLPVADDTLTRRGFCGWGTNDTASAGEVIDEEWVVPAAPDGVRLYAVWSEELNQVAPPSAADGLVYDGTEQTGVAAAAGYTVSDGSASAAGDYLASVTLEAGYAWTDGSTNPLQIAWSIAKATYDMSGVTFADATYDVDGAPHGLAIAGTLPDGVTVSYEGNDQSVGGTYQVWAVFAGDDENYEPIPEMSAVLTLRDVPLQAVDQPQAAGGAFAYTGAPQTGVVVRAGYTLTDNFATEAGSYTAIATLASGYIWSNGTRDPVRIPWSIAKAAYDMSGVTFEDQVFEFDGQTHALSISGTLPAGVEVGYEGNDQVKPGRYAVTAAFSGDAKNYEAIPSLTATMTIRNSAYQHVGDLYGEGQVQPFQQEIAGTYYGWLENADGSLAALLQVKTSAAKAGKACKSTVTVTPVGGKKKSYKTVVGPDSTDEFGIVYGALGLKGSVRKIPGVPDGAVVEAAKDFVKGKKDPAAQGKAQLIPVGRWTLAMQLMSGEGVDCLSVSVDKKGKAKVNGSLADGTAISISGMGAVGADAFAIPLVYSKAVKLKTTGVKTQVTIALVLWIDRASGRLSVSGDNGERWSDMVLGEGVLVRPADGPRTLGFVVPQFAGRAYWDRADGFTVTPAGLSVQVDGKKWRIDKTVGKVVLMGADALSVSYKPGQSPANLCKLKLSYTEKTGLVKGSFKLYYPAAAGKLKTDSATVTGVVVNDVFYGNAVIKKVGAAPIWWE